MLVLGASGGTGTAAVQLARILGAEVAGVASAKNHAWLRELGASAVYDYAGATPRASPVCPGAASTSCTTAPAETPCARRGPRCATAATR
ncbi:MAG: hypothetical protein U0325_36595 [Polyangiales bacterium]